MGKFKEYIKNYLHFSYHNKFLKKIYNLWKGKGAIICLHRVLPDKSVENEYLPNSNMSMKQSSFIDFTKYLSNNYNVVSIDELIRHLESNSNEFKLCLTFDDGYKDNINYALPVLEKFNLPAVIYICTNFIEGEAVMWWFELWECIIEKNSIQYGKKYLKCRTKSEKIKAFTILKNEIMLMSKLNQNNLLTEISDTKKRKNYSHLCMNWKDIKFLDKHELITIGSHSHSHSFLSNENMDNIKNDISKSKDILEKKLGHTIIHFAYPYGTKNSYGIREMNLIKNSKFKSAVSTECKKININNLYNLPRLGFNQNFNEDIFEARINGLCNLFQKQIC